MVFSPCPAVAFGLYWLQKHQDPLNPSVQDSAEWFCSVIDFCHIIPVVWPGGNTHWEAPLETRVAVSALHSWEVGPGKTLICWNHCNFTRTVEVYSFVTGACAWFVLLVQSGAAKCASRQEPGQWRPFISSAGGLSGLSEEPASKKLYSGIWVLLLWRCSLMYCTSSNMC